MRRRILIVALLIASSLARASSPVMTVVPDLPYLTPDRAEKLDLYLPARSDGSPLRAAVVWIHGGGWISGAKGEARAKEICSTLAGAGYVAVSLDYKMGKDSWPTCLLDCKNAVRFLRAHAKDYGIDPLRIGVAGGSAGGHLALMVGLTAGSGQWEPSAPYPGVSDAVRCIVDMYGPTDLVHRFQATESAGSIDTLALTQASFEAFGASPSSQGHLAEASPVTQRFDSCPPVLVMHGEADPLVNLMQSEALLRLLSAHGIEHESVILPAVGHSFDWEMQGDKALPRDLRPIALRFLGKHLAP